VRDFHNEDSLSCSCERCKGLPRPQDAHRIQDLEAQCAAIQGLVNQQAEDDGLWFRAQTAPEKYLQQELRKLHAAIEATDAGKALRRELEKAKLAASYRAGDRGEDRLDGYLQGAESMRERAAKALDYLAGRHQKRGPLHEEPTSRMLWEAVVETLETGAAAIRALPLEET
jgi:hypothetical protein